MIDVCCLQEVRWRGHGSWMLRIKGNGYKLWFGKVSYGEKRAVLKVVEIRRVCDKVMAVVLVFEADVLMLNCGYAPQNGRRFKKQSLYDELKDECNMHSADDLVMCLGDYY